MQATEYPTEAGNEIRSFRATLERYDAMGINKTCRAYAFRHKLLQLWASRVIGFGC